MKYDVCVFGGCGLDRFYYKNEAGEIPEAPSLIMAGGKGSNQAVAASRAGAKVTIISRIGKDDIGQKILENLVYNNITTNNIEVDDSVENDYADIIIDEKTKDNDIHRHVGAINSFNVNMVSKYKKVLLSSRMVVAQMKIHKEVSVELINFCYDNNIPLIITPCRPEKLSIKEEGNLELIDKITYITANQKECETIFGTDDIESCVTKYPNKLIVTLGANGVIYHDGKKIVKIDAVKTNNIEDTTGAGDTFNGNLVASLLKGYSLHDSIVRGQFASSMKIQKKGAQEGMPFKEELDTYIMNYMLDDNDYMSEFDLAYSSIIEASGNIDKKKIVNIKVKEDLTFVTESDLLVEKKLIDNIIKKYPNDKFVTEEMYSKNVIQERTWIIDPIDGTAHYMKNSIFWGIQLAFVDKGEIQFSMIYLPRLKEFYYGVRGKGVFLNHKKINLKEEVPLNQSAIEICGSLHKKYEDKKYLFNKILNNEVLPANFMHINTCAFAFANLLSSRTDTLILSTTKPWDILPGIFLVEELGMKTYSFSELKIYSNTKDFEKFLH